MKEFVVAPLPEDRKLTLRVWTRPFDWDFYSRDYVSPSRSIWAEVRESCHGGFCYHDGETLLSYPEGIPGLMVDFIPKGKIDFPNGNKERLQAMRTGSQDALHFMGALKKNKRLQSARWLAGTTNATMASFAIEYFGFHLDEQSTRPEWISETGNLNDRRNDWKAFFIVARKEDFLAKEDRVREIASKLERIPVSHSLRYRLPFGILNS